MELMDAIKGRRSVRRYRPEAVPEEALQVVLEAVRWAPSWANTQCWEVIVVKEAKTKEQVSQTLTATNPARSAIIEAPVVLVLCGKKGVAGYYKGTVATAKGDWLMFDLGLAMENLCLAAYGLGLGTVIVGLFDHRKAEEILKVPSPMEVIAMTPLGYPAREGGAPRRKELSEFVHFETYGEHGRNER